MMSGIRKEPPISTSSPRLTTALLPAANSASTMSTAAALLFTAMAASAPVRAHRRRSQWSWRLPRAMVFTLYSSVE